MILSRKISYDVCIRKVLLRQHFSNGGSLNEQWSLRFSGSWLYHTQEAMDQVNKLKLFEIVWLLQITLQGAAMSKNSGQMVSAGNWDPRVLALAHYPQTLL